MIVRGMKGLGDNIYQRAFVKQLQGPVYLETPWPELYEDLPGVKFVKAETPLRTQAKNMALQQATRWEAPPRESVMTVQYGSAGIVTGMRRCFGVGPGPFDLPDFGPSPVSGRYIVVRPATVRAEWVAEARNPLTMYIAEAAEAARAAGYRVISVADLEPGKEWAVGKLPPADEVYHVGEFGVRQLMALVRNAAAVIGGIGWILPAAIAMKVPAWVICGGQGGFNAPELITDEKYMDLSRIRFAVPDNLCRCRHRQHNCDKRIKNHASDFADWLRRLPDLVA